MCDLQSLDDFLSNFQKAFNELNTLLRMEKDTTEADSIQNLEKKLKKKINNKKAKFDSKINKLCTKLVFNIERMNLEETIKIINTLKSAFPLGSFNRLLLDLFTYSVLLYGHEQQFNDSLIKLNNFIDDCASNLQEIKENADFMNIKETISESVDEIGNLLKNKSLMSDDLPDEVISIKKDLHKIKKQLILTPIFTESQIQAAFDEPLKEYMQNLENRHNNEIQQLKQQLEKVEKERDNYKIDFEEIQNYNIDSYKELQQMRMKSNMESGNTKLLQVLLESNKKLQDDLKNSTDLLIDLTQQSQIMSNDLADELQKVKTQKEDLQNKILNQLQAEKLINDRLEKVNREYHKISKEYFEYKNNIGDLKEIENRIEEKTNSIMEIKAENEELKGEIAALKQNQQKQNLSKKASMIAPEKDGEFSDRIMQNIIILQELTAQTMNDKQTQQLYIAQQLAKQLEIKHLRETIDKLNYENARLTAEMENARKLGFEDPESLKNKGDSTSSLDSQALNMSYQRKMSELNLTNKLYLDILRQVKHKLILLHKEYISMHNYIADEFNSSQEKKDSIFQRVPQLLEKMKSLSLQSVIDEFN